MVLQSSVDEIREEKGMSVDACSGRCSNADETLEARIPCHARIMGPLYLVLLAVALASISPPG